MKDYILAKKNIFLVILILCSVVLGGVTFNVEFLLHDIVLFLTSFLCIVFSVFSFNLKLPLYKTIFTIKIKLKDKVFMLYHYEPIVVLYAPISRLSEYSYKFSIIVFLTCFTFLLLSFIRVKVSKP